ncbi:MAG TPA: hypothetical protein VGY54_01110, partial [Polyangiaceae bacterium]|nr:hypothetical protein [Polyangiaceae bacterium]
VKGTRGPRASGRRGASPLAGIAGEVESRLRPTRDASLHLKDTRGPPREWPARGPACGDRRRSRIAAAADT